MTVTNHKSTGVRSYLCKKKPVKIKHEVAEIWIDSFDESCMMQPIGSRVRLESLNGGYIHGVDARFGRILIH